MDAAIEVAKVLGLPGLVVVVWYLIERDRTRSNAKAEADRTAAMTVGFQSLSGKIDSHASEDAERHGETREAIVDLRARFDVLHDLTPVEGPPRQHPRPKTNPRGVQAGYYGPRPGTRDDGGER